MYINVENCKNLVNTYVTFHIIFIRIKQIAYISFSFVLLLFNVLKTHFLK